MPLLPINWLNLLSRPAGGPSGPVQLTIAFVATQFVFKWKAPAGSTLRFNWGDGTYDDVSGNDATLVTTTSSYSGAGTYSFWITGDVTDLTYIDISEQAFVSGDISRWWTELINLEYYDISGTSITGYPPFSSDLSLLAEGRNGLTIPASIGDDASILTPCLRCSTANNRWVQGLKTRSQEHILDGNSYTVFYKVKRLENVAESGFIEGTRLINLGSNTGNQRGVDIYGYNHNLIFNVSDGTSRTYSPMLTAINSNFPINVWIDLFIEIDFAAKEARAGFYNGDTLVGSGRTYDISAYNFTSDDNFAEYTFGLTTQFAFCDFKKFSGLKTLAQCQDDDYTTDLQIWYPDMVSGTDVSGNNLHLQRVLIDDIVDVYYSNAHSYFLDNGCSLYQYVGSDDIYVPLDINGSAPDQDELGDFLKTETMEGNALYHNLSSSMIEFAGSQFDRSDTDIYKDEARLNYYDSANPKRWHVSELNRLIMGDYFKTAYMGTIFPHCESNSYDDRSYLKEIFSYTTNKSGDNFNAVLSYTGDRGVNTTLYLKTPYTDIVKITADGDAVFKFNINNSIIYEKQDIWDRIDAMSLLDADEDEVSKIFRWVSNNQVIQSNYSETLAVIANTINQLNSVNNCECSGVAIFGYNIFEHYYPGLARGYSRSGHVTCGLVAAWMDIGYKILQYVDKYDPASLDEIIANDKLYIEALRRTAYDGLDYNQAGADLVKTFVRSETYEVASVIDDLNMQLPNTAYFEFPFRSTNVPDMASGSPFVYYHSGKVTVPTGITGTVSLPMTLVLLTGTGTVTVDGTGYTLPGDEAELTAVLQEYEDFYNEFTINTNTGGIAAEYLVNARRLQLYDQNAFVKGVVSGDITVGKSTTSDQVPTFPLNVNKGNAAQWTENYDKFWSKNKSFLHPRMAVSADLPQIVFLGTGDKPVPIRFGTTGATFVAVTAGADVEDQCFSALLTPTDDSFSESLELTFTAVDGSSIYYTTDESDPDETDNLYSDPFTITSTTTLKWIAIQEGFADSHINTRVITKL